jgi:GTPase
LGGTVLKGTIKINDEMMFGPDRNGAFKPVTIKGIHENRVEIDQAEEMTSVCLHIKTIGKNVEIRPN